MPCALGVISVTLAACAGATPLRGAATAAEVASLFTSTGDAPTEQDVLDCVQRGWWESATHLVRLAHDRGLAVDEMSQVLSAATRSRDEASEVLSLLRYGGSVGAHAEETVVACAFQWAQSEGALHLNVKFSSRIDGPVTVLNVDNEKVRLSERRLDFSATGRQKPKQFTLQLDLHGEIVPESSSWSFASVGRMTFTIAKAVNETWPRLLKDQSARPTNMHHWVERQACPEPSPTHASLDAEAKKSPPAPKPAAEGKADAKSAGDAKPADGEAPAADEKAAASVKPATGSGDKQEL
ncbi:hypothetical protein EMIHUDRAFT_99915 [Emiliania huxleyi CCMP1516]|uniref:CS domain-containing protein n=2 Tax=Emiliania huxleyi TaxID=2903 RepID=A0A0D3JY31_EMIH1|nr:hypothetical protein EMIHUDRAFT_99915 [Emiliania huxleyi CCMP1516]EOD28416.1 hypothetical protein EMIHUDRAFT_99915 [Emiliania huxleyi CCMP1516]|eukprot:XP_005780845.1 hypothetical protein EMIHUDRAFT_99915 [Emiliania huxleyi CCMP1516]